MRKLGGGKALVLLAAAMPFASGCRGSMAKIDAVRDALVTDDVAPIADATAGFPTCSELPAVATPPGAPGPYDAGCLSAIANALGSKRGFVGDAPDHAAATTAALVVLREGRGDWLANADAWLADVKSGKGTGHDALRLAIARRMTESAATVGRKIEDDASANAAMKAVVSAIPGACPTYWLLGSGVDATTLATELSADHAACVQRDLARREGPGASYGTGRFRALEGALALWRETERALRMGLALAEPGPKAALEQKLARIEEATRKIETRRLAPASVAMLGLVGGLHMEAGVPIASADGGAP